MGFEALVEAFLLLLDRRHLASLQAELWKFAEALDQWLHDLFASPRPDWRAGLQEFLAAQEAEGRIATPESRQSLRDYLRWWAITIGLEEPGVEPELPDDTTEALVASSTFPPADARAADVESADEADRDPTPAELLMPIVEEQIRLDSLITPFEPELPPRLEYKPRVVKTEVIKSFWDDYRALLESGKYEQGWWESISYGFTGALLPASEPGQGITFDDGTVLLLIGGGPESGALAEQATIFTGFGGAAIGARTLWGAVFSATKHLGRETAEQIADGVVQQVTGLPVGPAGLLPNKRKSSRSHGDSKQPAKSREIEDLRRRSAEDANAEHVRKGNYPPHYSRVAVRDFMTKQELNLVRVYADRARRQGSWMVRARAIAGMTPAEIKTALGLQHVPKYIVDVTVPIGTRMRLSIVGPQPQWSIPTRGVHQYEALQRLPVSAFANGRRL